MGLGLRMSEIHEIRYSDIKNNVFTIQHAIVDGAVKEKEAMKTYNSTRQLLVPQYILNLIEDDWNEDDPIVPLSGAAIYKRWIHAPKRVGTEPIRFDDLHHLHVSVVVAFKGPDRYAIERSGWSSSKVLQRVYQHTFCDERQRIDRIVHRRFLF